MTDESLRFLTLGIELNSEETGHLHTVHQTLDRLSNRRKDILPISGELEAVLRQVILYRIVATASGTIVNWNTGNVLCSFLTARALFETFAFLWDYERAINDAKKIGSLAQFKMLTEKRLGATKNESRLGSNPEWEATNILTLMSRLSEQYPWALKAYDLMSARCHPNTEGMLETFVDLDTERREVRLSTRNDTQDWAFKMVFGVTCLIVEAERVLDKLESETAAIEKEIRDREFKRNTDASEREQKQFERFCEDESQAFQGNPSSQFAIARTFGNGAAMVLKDLFHAYFWSALAASQGISGAAQYRDKIAEGMSPKQINEAQALAQSWKPMTADEWETHNREIVDRLRAQFEPSHGTSATESRWQ